MKNQLIRNSLACLVFAVGLVCAWQLQVRIDAERRAIATDKDELMLRSGSLIKKLSLEYAPLVGAIYWTRAVQYYGEKHRLHDNNLELLWPLLDIATTADPKLIPAYHVGSMFLSDSPPRGAGDPDTAAKLLQRGMEHNPDYWRFYQDLGYVYYFDKKDYLKASQAFETGSRYPGTPPWMKIMAAKIAAEGESLETSYALWGEIYNTTKDKDIRKNAEEHLRIVRAKLDLRELDRIADEYEKTHKVRPTRVTDLIQAGLLSGVPKDPNGFPYVVNEEGKVDLNPKSPLVEARRKANL